MKIAILIPIIVLVLVAVGIGWLVTSQKAAPRTVEQAIENLFSLKSFKIDGKVEANIQAATEQGTQGAKISLGFVDVIDISEPENPKSSGNISISLAAEGMEFSLAGDIRTFGQDIYFRVTTLPAFLPIPVDLEGIKNQWFKIETEKLKEMTAGMDVPAPDEQEAKEILKGLAGLLKGKEFFKVEKDLGKEVLDGKEAEHYLVGVQKKTVKEFIPEFLQFMKNYVSEEQKQEYEKNLQETLKDFSQKFDEAWDEFEGISFEVWIEKNTLKKVKWEGKIDLTSFEQLQGKIEQGNVELVFEVKFSDFNEKFEIKEPADFKPFEELIPVIMFQTPELSVPEYPLE